MTRKYSRCLDSPSNRVLNGEKKEKKKRAAAVVRPFTDTHVVGTNVRPSHRNQCRNSSSRGSAVKTWSSWKQKHTLFLVDRRKTPETRNRNYTRKSFLVAFRRTAAAGFENVKEIWLISGGIFILD